jgi:hypothetical protein
MIKIEFLVSKIRAGWSEEDFDKKLGIGIRVEDELDSLLNDFAESYNEEWGELEKQDYYCFRELDDQMHFVDYLIHIGEIEPDGVVIDNDYYYIIPDM